MTAAAYQPILDRRLGAYRVPPGWMIVAAGNRHGDHGVSYVMPTPLANRFTHYEIEANLDDWVAWAHAAGIDPRVIAFLRFRPDLLLYLTDADGEFPRRAPDDLVIWLVKGRGKVSWGDRIQLN